MKLSRRLACIADLIPADARSLIDLGYDHGHLLHWAHEQGMAPLLGIEQSAHFAEWFRRRYPHDPVVLRTGNALEVMDSHERYDCLLIAGLGEEHIRHICRSMPTNDNYCEHLILSPSTIDLQLRPFLNEHGWYAQHESLIQERGKWYSVSHFIRGREPESDPWRCAIGPRLFEQHHELLPDYLRFLERRFHATCTTEMHGALAS